MLSISLLVKRQSITLYSIFLDGDILRSPKYGIFIDGEERAGCFTLTVFLVLCDWPCSVALLTVPWVGLHCVIVVILILLTCSVLGRVDFTLANIQYVQWSKI